MGTKKRIHIQVNGILEQEIRAISKTDVPQTEKLAQLASLIDLKIWCGYRLWPSNYIAHDLLSGDARFAEFYTQEEKQSFEKRLHGKVDTSNPFLVKSFLSMYASPVDNSLKASQK